MGNQNEVILENGLEVTGATLLTVEEAKALPEETLSLGCWWWLRSPGKISDSAANVGSGGSVNRGGFGVSYIFAVRPALELSALESSNLDIGDKFQFGEKEFEVISTDRALCTESIGDCEFRRDWETADANVYETSDIKKFVDDWYQSSVSSRFPGKLFHNHQMAENLRKMYELSVAVLNEAEDISSYSDCETELLEECANVMNFYEKIIGL